MDRELSKEDHVQLYGDPRQVIQFMDYSNESPEADNGLYIPNLVPGQLQPLEELLDTETDQLLSTIDIEALVKKAEQSTGGLPPSSPPRPSEKSLKCFGDVMTDSKLKEVSNHSFSAAMKRKALWAVRIFEQWKCI